MLKSIELVAYIWIKSNYSHTKLKSFIHQNCNWSPSLTKLSFMVKFILQPLWWGMLTKLIIMGLNSHPTILSQTHQTKLLISSHTHTSTLKEKEEYSINNNKMRKEKKKRGESLRCKIIGIYWNIYYCNKNNSFIIINKVIFNLLSWINEWKNFSWT